MLMLSARAGVATYRALTTLGLYEASFEALNYGALPTDCTSSLGYPRRFPS